MINIDEIGFLLYTSQYRLKVDHRVVIAERYIPDAHSSLSKPVLRRCARARLGLCVRLCVQCPWLICCTTSKFRSSAPRRRRRRSPTCFVNFNSCYCIFIVVVHFTRMVKMIRFQIIQYMSTLQGAFLLYRFPYTNFTINANLKYRLVYYERTNI